MSDRANLEERRNIALRDLQELAEQVEAGEIDEETAATLRSGYQAELDDANAQLDAIPSRPRKPEPGRESATDVPRPRSARRAIVGSILVIAALSVAIFLAAGDIAPDSSTPTTAAAAPGGMSVDPSSITNEQLEAVVAANPEINAMRLALADRYFEEQNFNKALDHYLVIAENNPTPAEEGRALSRIGWMAYTTGQPETAEQYLQTSLTVDPTNGETKLFLGFVYLYGLGDAEAAIPWLEEVAGFTDLPEPIRAEVELALEEARAGGSG